MHKGRRKEKRLSLKQVARLNERRNELGRTLKEVRQRFDRGLRRKECILNDDALIARANRIFNPAMRGPLNAENRVILAEALEWSVEKLEEELGLTRLSAELKRAARYSVKRIEDHNARQVALAALVQIETYQIGRGVDLEKDNLTRVYSAAYRMFGRIRELMCELPAHEFGKDGSIAAIYEALNSVLNTTLRPHLTEWPERYEDWRKNFGKTTKGKKLSPQEMQQMFPERPAIQRDLKDVARRLKADAKKLRSLILKA